MNIRKVEKVNPLRPSLSTMVSCSKCNAGFTSEDSAALRCSKCTAAYHRKCSDIIVPESAGISKSWLCSNCASKSVIVPSTSDATVQSNGQCFEQSTSEVKAVMVTATKSSGSEVLQEIKLPDSSASDLKIVNKGIQAESEKEKTIKGIEDSTFTAAQSPVSEISKHPTEFKSVTVIEEFHEDTKTTSVFSDLSVSQDIVKHEPFDQPEGIKIDEPIKSLPIYDTMQKAKTSAGPEFLPKSIKAFEDDEFEQQSDTPYVRPEENETDPLIFVKVEDSKGFEQHSSSKDEFPTFTLSKSKSAEDLKTKKELLVPLSDRTSNIMDPMISDYVEDVKIFKQIEETEPEVAIVTTREGTVNEFHGETTATMLPHETLKLSTESSLISDSKKLKVSDEIDFSDLTDTKAIATNLSSSIIDVSATQPLSDQTSNIGTDLFVSTHTQCSLVESEKQNSTLHQIPGSIFSQNELTKENMSCVSSDETSEIPLDASSSSGTGRSYHRSCQTMQNTIAGINAKMQEVLLDISDLKEKQEVNYKEQCNLMNEMHRDPVNIETLEQQLQANMKENENLRNKTNLLKERIKDVESTVARMNQESRADLLEIHGLPVQPDENLNEIIMKICQMLGVKIKSEDIVFCRRKNASLTPNKRPSMVLVKLRSKQLRNDILMKRKIMREFNIKDLYPEKSGDSQIYLNESLSFNLRQIYAYARKIRKNGIIKFVWISHGKVLIRSRDNEPAFSVTHIQELQSLGNNNKL